MYLFLSFLLFLLLLLLTVAGETKFGKTHPRMLFCFNGLLGVAGIVTLAAAFFAARAVLYGGGFDEEFISWAWDMLIVYYQISFFPLLLLFLIAVLACVVAAFDRKQQTGVPLKLRLSVVVVFSAVMLLLAPMYSFMTVNEKVALDLYVLVSGFGEALVLRLPLLIEYGGRMRAENRKENSGHFS